MRNLHKYYYKDYFSESSEQIVVNRQQRNVVLNWINSDSDDNKSIIKVRNAELCKPIPNYRNPIEKNPLVNTDFSLTIQYPGLVTGIGIDHEAKIEGEFKLGVHFDWTHGMPVVYGSSVKGVLRAWFKEFYKPNKTQPSVDDAFDSIFEGKENGKPKSIYDRDIFFDAVITQADSKGRILCSDSITPHGGENHDNPLKNPTPLTFMKIAPGCTMEFRFKLVPSVINGKEFSASQKKALFEEILKTVGIGAKTNVGYGQFR